MARTQLVNGKYSEKSHRHLNGYEKFGDEVEVAEGLIGVGDTRVVCLHSTPPCIFPSRTVTL